MSNVRYVGLDVHKDSIVMSVAESGNAEAKVLGTFPNDINKIIKQLKKLSPDVSLLRVCYEAGPTGFGLSRRLKKEGIDCIVVAPSLVPQKAGLRVKTDRRDSRKLAHNLRSGDLTQVWVPDEQTEALRDLERTRDDAKNAERTARHQLSKFLLRDEAHRDIYRRSCVAAAGEGDDVISRDSGSECHGDCRGDRRSATLQNGSSVHGVSRVGSFGIFFGKFGEAWFIDEDWQWPCETYSDRSGSALSASAGTECGAAQTAGGHFEGGAGHFVEGSAKALQPTDAFHQQRQASQQSNRGAGSRTGGFHLEPRAGFATAGVKPAFQISNLKSQISNNSWPSARIL
jgi:hypothetical protein